MNYLNGNVQKNNGSPCKIDQQLCWKHRLQIFDPLGAKELREKGGQIEKERVDLVGKVVKEQFKLCSVELPILEPF